MADFAKPKTMRIGIDFDNTIVYYDKAFHTAARENDLIPMDFPEDKNRIRNCLRQIGKEDEWTRLQGIVYGTRMDEATPFPGVFDFIRFCNQNSIAVFIISHKTRNPIIGPNHDLHEAAYHWLRIHGFFDPADLGFLRGQVFFEPTKEDKLKRIGQIGCTHFIDDLPEFLAEPGFPRDTHRILFDPKQCHVHIDHVPRSFASWHQLVAWIRQSHTC